MNMSWFDIFKNKTQEKTFVCTKCKRRLAIKYLHKDNICANCFATPVDSLLKERIPAKKPNQADSCMRTTDIRAVDFHTFKRKCDFTDSTNLFYCFTYVIDAHMGGRDLIHVFSNQSKDKFYLQREVTETRPVASPHSGLVDERTKDIAGFLSVSKQAVKEMAVDRYEWIKSCNFTHDSKYETEAKNCVQILESVEDITEYSNVTLNAEQQYDIIKKKEERKVQNKCTQCFLPIDGYGYTIDNNHYCRECYNRKMAVIQQTEGQGKATNHTSNTLPQKNFICAKCNRKFDVKYLHGDNICSDCLTRITSFGNSATASDSAESYAAQRSYLLDDECKSVLPKTLFEYRIESYDEPNDMVCRCWENVVLRKDGKLILEINSTTFDAHSIGRNTGVFTTSKPILFEQLPKMIEQSSDPKAQNYIGMNALNWPEYIKDKKANRETNFEKLNDHISWKIENSILYIQGHGSLTPDDYLTITAPAPRYETESYSGVLPWAVCNSIRQSKYISEGYPVSEIPTHIKEVVVDGEIEGLKQFLLNANNYVGVQLQSPEEYFYTINITSDNPKQDLILLVHQLLEDIKKICPLRLSYYEDMFEKTLNGRFDYECTLEYNSKEGTYDLAYWERGHVVGGIKEKSFEDFRFSFLQHEFFATRLRYIKKDLENMLLALWPLFENKEIIKQRIKAYQAEYELGEFDLETMTFKECADDQHHFTDLKHFSGGSDCKCQKCGLAVKFNRGWSDRIEPKEWDAFLEKYKGSKIDFHYSPDNKVRINDLETIIRNDSYDTWISLCLHKATNEVYMVHGKNTFLGDTQKGGQIESQISSISLASLEDASSMVNKELDYHSFYQAHYRNISQKNLMIAQKAYRIEFFVVIDNIEVPQNQIMFGESVFEVPAKFLTEEQHKKYAEFYTRPGPYEHCFDLPSECCQKVIRKIVPCVLSSEKGNHH